jgi:hypothetical protein
MMQNYKDLNNQVHSLPSEEFEAYLPAGCVKISDDELADLRAPTPKQLSLESASKAQSALDEIDLKSIRAIREFVASLPFFAPKQVKELEADAGAERAKLSE